MSILKEILNAVLGRSKIEHVAEQIGHPRLLHISDTPSQFYTELSRIIKELKPDYIIHTGDLADNIKIGLYPSSMVKYKHEVKKLIQILDSSGAKKVVITLGNHDDHEYLNSLGKGLLIYEGLGILELEGITVAFSHYSKDLEKVTADLRLYGHDLEDIEDNGSSQLNLNGIVSMSIIDLVTLDVKKIEYPIGTDNARLNKKKIGI